MAYSIDEIREHLTSYQTARSDAVRDHVELYKMVESLLSEIDAGGAGTFSSAVQDLEAQVTALQDENDALSRDKDKLAEQLADLEATSRPPPSTK